MLERRTAGGIIGLPTPWTTLTQILRGLVPKNSYIIAAQQKIGKTQKVICLGEYLYQEGYNVLVISMEMSREEYMARTYALTHKLSLDYVLSGKISTPLETAIREDILADDKENKFSFYEGFFAMSVVEIEQLVALERPDILIIDGAYLIKPRDKNSRMAGWEHQTQIAKDLKGILGRYEIPGVFTYQFNEKDDVHLSKALPQIATAVMGVYELRDRLHARRTRVRYNRNGPTGEITWNFDFNRASFTEIEGGDDNRSDLSLFGGFGNETEIQDEEGIGGEDSQDSQSQG
jgi:replicative DNA helicase